MGRFRRIWKGALLLAIGAAGGGAALAVASVPDSSGVIHACYVDIGKGDTVPSPVEGNIRIIDSASQSCTTSGGTTEIPLNWSVTGPQGATGPAGAAGPAGAPGQTSTTVVTSTGTTPSTNRILTVSIAPGTTVSTPSGVIVASGTPDILLAAPKIKQSAPPIGTLKLGTLNLDVLGLEFASSRNGHQLNSVLVTLGRGSVPAQLANGRTFSTVSLQLKKAGHTEVVKLSNVIVADVEQTHDLNTIVLGYTKIQITHTS